MESCVTLFPCACASSREKSTLDQGMEWYGIKNFTHETKNRCALKFPAALALALTAL